MPATTPHPPRRGRPTSRLAAALRAEGLSVIQIADVFRNEYRFGALAAMRKAHGWSQSKAADVWNQVFPGELKTNKNFSYWENCHTPYGRVPDLRTLDKLARIYQCRVGDLVVDWGDYRPTVEEPPVIVPDFFDEQVIKEAFARAEELEREALARWPHVWDELDRIRTDPPGTWPEWCLLPSAATAVVIGAQAGDRPAPVAAVSAVYAWRFARSVYALDPELAKSLIGGVVEDLSALKRLPEWCVYLASDRADNARVGLWACLDYHAETGRPELRLLLDLAAGGLDSLICVPVYLDRPTLTEALADWRAVTMTGSTDVHGGELDGTIATFADAIERLLALVTHLTASGDHVRPLDGTSTRPHRRTRPTRSQTVWLVGAANALSPPRPGPPH